MSRTKYEVADVISKFGKQFIEQYYPNAFQQKVLRAISNCRTVELGYHKDKCDCCGQIRISYNSCRNRNCPKCQSTKQAFWVEDLMQIILPVKHYHMVFTIPHELNEISMLNSRWFYNLLFANVWDTIRTFGYTHFSVESGAVAVLHTWGQNLSLHPHVHCIVPAAGLTFAENLKHIGKNGKYLYSVRKLSATFRGKMMQGIKKYLKTKSKLKDHQSALDNAWKKSWVVFCEQSLGKPEHVVKYLGQYTHRVAITNHRLLNIDNSGVTFLHKNYRKNAKQITTKLNGVEFLRRFCQHILPLRFVKIRRYGIYSSRYRSLQKKENLKMVIKPKKETTQERIFRITGFDLYLCPFCKKGKMQIIEVVPRIRSPDYTQKFLLPNKLL